MEDEYQLKKRQKQGAGLRPFLPVIGFFLAVAMGAIAFILGEPLAVFAAERMNFVIDDTMIWVFRVVIFVLLLCAAAALLAIASPKQKVEQMATEKQLKLEKKEKEQERLMRKEQQREIQKKMAEENRRKSGGK